MTQTSVDLIIQAKYIVPMNSHHSKSGTHTSDTQTAAKNRVLDNHSIVIDQGRILAIDTSQTIGKRYQAQESVDLGEHILMPGLINTHGHAAMSLLRGYADDQPLNIWLEQHIWPAEAAHVSPEFVYQGTELAIAEMLKSGTTCFSDMYFYPEEAAKCVHKSGIRSQIAFPILEFPTAWAANADEYITKGLALYDDYRSHPLISVAFGPHAPYTVNNDTFRRIVTLATEMQAPIQIHLHETQAEVDKAVTENGERPIERLNRLGLLGPNTQCVHMTALNDQDIALIAASGAHVVHCPESNLKLASGFCPIIDCLEAGINIGLGTDGCASNNDLDMFGELQTAALLAKATSANAAALAAYDALAMATINGAKALGLDDEIGSLEVGKAADIIAVKIDPIKHLPLYNPLSLLVYNNVGTQVSHSWVAGRRLLDDGKLCTLNQSEITANTQAWQSRIANTHF